MEETFWQRNGDEISAAITLVVAIVLAIAVDRLLIARAERATQRLETAQFSREARTRLRLIRRLTFLAIIVIGIGLALSQFADIKRLATGLLASTAVLGLILGFAGRTVIANFVGGVMMAITQPIRIGDSVSIGGEIDGRITDIALTYTTLDTGDGAVTVIPNERVVTEVVINRSTGNPKAPLQAEVWIPRDADVGGARRALEGVGVAGIRLAELTTDGARLELTAAIEPGRERVAGEAELRERGQAALRSAGILGERSRT
jgi:small-conductance mechanosensitive channel